MSPPLPPRPAVLLLDAGNTLVYLDTEAVAGAVAAEGADVEVAALRDAVGPAHREYEALMRGGGSHEKGWRLLMTVLLVRAGLPRSDAERLLPALERAQMDFNFWRSVPDGLPGALDRLREAGTRLGVVSNSEGHIAETLTRVGLGGRFEVVVDSGREGVRKPDPEIFWRATRRLGVDPADCIYVGDIPGVDVTGARAAGLDAVLVDPWGIWTDYEGAPRVVSVMELAVAWLGA